MLQSLTNNSCQCAGTNNVDLKKADSLGLKVTHVPSYSPHAVAEFTVGLILTTVRKYHKSYNRVREGDFTLTGSSLSSLSNPQSNPLSDRFPQASWASTSTSKQLA